MRNLFTGCLALAFALLAGCASTPTTPAGATVGLEASQAESNRAHVFATLATTPCEIATAAGMTAIAQSRIRAGRWLAKDRITVAQAKHVLELADRARSSRGLACDGDNVNTFGVVLFGSDVANLIKTVESYRANR